MKTSYFLVAAVVLSVGLSPPRAFAADSLYIVEGPRGSVTFTTRKPKAGEKYRVAGNKFGKFSRVSVRKSYRSGVFRPVRSSYDKLIISTAKQNRLEPALVKAVVHVESAFRPRARSHKGAIGLMQLMPGTARRFGVRNSYDPVQNVKGGSKYLRFLLDRYRGNLTLALAAYNAGEGAVDKYSGIPPYRETQDYVKLVLRARKVYRATL